MQTKHLTKQVIKDTLEQRTYYLLEGDCPELMSFARLREYVQNIITSNVDDGDFPDHLNETVHSEEEAEKVINWFGEEIFKIEIPPQSMEFITE